MTGLAVHLSGLCGPVTHLWLVRAGCQQPGPHCSPLVTSHRSPSQGSLSERKFHFVTTSSPSLLMTHNLMLNVIRPRRRRQEFSTDQTYIWPVNICEVLNLKVKYLSSLVLTIVHGSLLCGNHQSPEASSALVREAQASITSLEEQNTSVLGERGMNATYHAKSQCS